MYESLGFEELTPLGASVLLGLALGGVYGVLAQRSAFCLRRSLVGEWRDCLPALGVWVMGLATAIAGTRLAVGVGLVSFESHRFPRPRPSHRFRPDWRRAVRGRHGADRGLRLAAHGARRRREPPRPARPARVRGHRPRDDEGGARAAPGGAGRHDRSRRRRGRADLASRRRALAVRPRARRPRFSRFAPARGLPISSWRPQSGCWCPSAGSERGSCCWTTLTRFPCNHWVSRGRRVRHPLLGRGGYVHTGRLRYGTCGGCRCGQPTRGCWRPANFAGKAWKGHGRPDATSPVR